MSNYDEALEKAMVGETNFSIDNIFSEAWQKVKGVKASLWGGFVWYLIVAIVIGMLIGITSSIVGAWLLPDEAMRHAAAQWQSLSQLPTPYITFQVGMQLVQLILTVCVYFPMLAGLLLISLRWVNQKVISVSYVTKFFTKEYIVRFFFMWLCMTLIMFVPIFIIGILIGVQEAVELTLPLKAMLVTVYVLLILGLIYLMTSFVFAMPLIVDRFLKGWESLKVSRKVVTHHWFRVFILFFLMGIVLVLSAIPLGILLIWTMPWAYNVFSIAYRELFGIAGQDPVSLGH